MASQPQVRILLVEDSEEDALLLSAHLRGAGLPCALTRVDEMEPLQAALTSQAWNLLLTDFALPTMDGLDVIQEARRLAPELPCIVVSGRIGEEAAVEALRAGAKDFVREDAPCSTQWWEGQGSSLLWPPLRPAPGAYGQDEAKGAGSHCATVR